jgi:hypothetical protein
MQRLRAIIASIEHIQAGRLRALGVATCVKRDILRDGQSIVASPHRF